MPTFDETMKTATRSDDFDEREGARAELRYAFECCERAEAGLEYAEREQDITQGGINPLTVGDYELAAHVLRRVLGTEEPAGSEEEDD